LGALIIASSKRNVIPKELLSLVRQGHKELEDVNEVNILMNCCV